MRAGSWPARTGEPASTNVWSTAPLTSERTVACVSAESEPDNAGPLRISSALTIAMFSGPTVIAELLASAAAAVVASFCLQAPDDQRTVTVASVKAQDREEN